MEFKNKVALVTGAGQGIGYEICNQLALKGATVILNDINAVLAETAVSQINGHAEGRCVGLAGDSSDIDFIKQMVQYAVDHFGKLDIAIANAGITLFGDFFNYTPESFFKVMQVNLGGTFFLAQAASNQMKHQENGGTILFTSSITAHQAHKDLAAYGMSKASLEMLARNLVIELSPYKINVNAIAPGATLTERTLQDAAYQEAWNKITPMGRPAYVSEVAAAALFLVSDKAKQITGQTLIIDGGWSCVSPSPF